MCKGNHKLYQDNINMNFATHIKPSMLASVKNKATTAPGWCYSLGRHVTEVFFFLGKERKPSKLDSRIRLMKKF